MAESKSKFAEEEILEAMKEFNIPVTRNDLKTPTKEFVARVFECFLNTIEISYHSLKTFKATSHIEDPDLYEEGQYLILLAIIVDNIFQAANLNITVKDILEPKPKRTKKIIHHILVFLTYYVRKYNCYCNTEKALEDKRKRVEDIKLENLSLDEKYEEKLQILKSMVSKEDIKDIYEEKRNICKKKEAQKHNVVSEYQELKTKHFEIQNKISSLDVKIASSKERLEELKQLVLSSPDRMTKEVQNLKQKVKSEDLKIKEKETEVKEAERKVQFQATCINESDKAFSILNALKQKLQNLEEAGKLNVRKQQQIDDDENRLKKLQLELENVEGWQKQCTQDIVKRFLNTKKQKETTKELLNMLEKDKIKEKNIIELLKTENEKLQMSIDNVSDNVLKINSDYKAAAAEFDQRLAEYKNNISQMKDDFITDCEELKNFYSNEWKSL